MKSIYLLTVFTFFAFGATQTSLISSSFGKGKEQVSSSSKDGGGSHHSNGIQPGKGGNTSSKNGGGSHHSNGKSSGKGGNEYAQGSKKQDDSKPKENEPESPPEPAVEAAETPATSSDSTENRPEPGEQDPYAGRRKVPGIGSDKPRPKFPNLPLPRRPGIGNDKPRPKFPNLPLPRTPCRPCPPGRICAAVCIPNN